MLNGGEWQQDSATVKKVLFECADRLNQRSDEMYQAGILSLNDLTEIGEMIQKIKLGAEEFAESKEVSSPSKNITTNNDSKGSVEIEMILKNQVEKAKALLDQIQEKTDSGKIPRIDYDLILSQIYCDRAQLELFVWKSKHTNNATVKVELQKMIHDKYEELSEATEQFAKSAEKMYNVGVLPLREYLYCASYSRRFFRLGARNPRAL